MMQGHLAKKLNLAQMQSDTTQQGAAVANQIQFLVGYFVA